MSLRRGAIRIATVLALVGGLVAIGAAPAQADEDRVGIKLPGSFKVGGPGGVTVSVVKRTPGCVSVRTALAINLPGLAADQVQVEVASGGAWRGVITSNGGGGLIVTERTAPDKPQLCERKGVSARYRVQFLAGAPSGTANIVGEAYGVPGGVIGRATGARKVTGGVSVTPTPRVSKSPSPSPSPSESASPKPEKSEDAAVETGQSPVVAGLAAPPTSGSGDGFFGLGTMVMTAGAAMVAVGIALIVFLLRRGKTEQDEPTPVQARGFGPPPPGGDGDATMILPRVPY